MVTVDGQLAQAPLDDIFESVMPLNGQPVAVYVAIVVDPDRYVSVLVPAE